MIDIKQPRSHNCLGKTMKKICILAIGLMALPALADNNQGYYFGVGFSSIEDYQDGVSDISRMRAGELFGGYKYNDALGVEVRFGNAQTSGTSGYYPLADKNGVHQKETGWQPTFGDVERSLGSYQSIYYKPELVNDEAKLYALIGYTSIDTSVKVWSKDKTVKTPIKQSSDSISGLSYGVGVGFVLSDQFNLNIEYKNLCEKLSEKPNALSISIDYRL